ncbi:hypothetical protein NDU88_000820 [Pleurodeles waltl]|uniref:Uncharacterized protein n=1 Tax=Pleurodeles waltl TaxID=8319 RepID=A0AAV7TG22_PLEWA|nr:hypothetical protein NDU88_000820 [Pleurodeles waltl]
MGCEVTALALYTVAVGSRRPWRNAALVNIGPHGSQEPMTMYASGDGTHRSRRDRRGRDNPLTGANLNLDLTSLEPSSDTLAGRSRSTS